MTAPAAVSWAACLGWINLHGSPLQWMGSRIAVAIFSVAAVAELVADKLPKTPNRTAPGPLIGRIVLGGLAGACLAISMSGSWLTGAVLGGIGAVIGAFAGYEARRRLVRGLGAKDAVVAVVEDLVAIGLAYMVVTRV